MDDTVKHLARLLRSGAITNLCGRPEHPCRNPTYTGPAPATWATPGVGGGGGGLNQAFPTIQETLEKWTQRGSGWVVDRVEVLWLDIARYQPLRGGCYIPLPAAVRLKKAVVNVKNKDNHCLRWALRSALFPVAQGQHAYRPSKYPQQDGLDFTGIDAPTPISQIPRVEQQNDLSINVFGWDKGVIVHHISKQPRDMPRINLLLIEKAGKFHYTRIKDLNRLLHDQSKYNNRKHYCERCLHGYKREDLLEAHKPECRGIGQTAVRVEMPKEGKNAQAFQNHHKQLPAPYIIYADWGSHRQSRDLSSTPRRAILNGHNTTRLVVIATSWCDVMATQSRQSNIEVPTQQSTS